MISPSRASASAPSRSAIELQVEGGELGQHVLRHHQDLEAVGQPLGQHALVAEAALQPQAQVERAVGQREVAQRLLVALDAASAHGVDQPIGARRQDRHHAPRQGLLIELLEIELPLLGAQGQQADRQALIQIEREVGRRRLDGLVAGGDRIDVEAVDPHVVLADDLLQVMRDIDPRQRQHAVAQRELQPAQPVEAQHVHHQAERGGVDEQGEQHEQRRQHGGEFADIRRQADRRPPRPWRARW